ncbi:hypothetical protein JCM11641_004933 [Rhodosporidiobolus odoratus]
MSAPVETTSTPPSTEHPIEQAIQATPQELGHKVFVGNLPFDASGEGLKEIFGKVGEVTDAQIIHRGTRSLGYGFVTYTAEDDAAKAVSQLDKTEISGRQVNVEVAKPMPTNGGALARAPRRAAKKAAATAATAETAQEGVAGEEAADAEAKAPKKKSRKAQRKPRGPRAPRIDDETEEAGDAPVAAVADQLANTDLKGDSEGTAAPRSRKPRARKVRKGKAAAPASGDALNGEPGAPPAVGEPVAPSQPKPRQPRQPRRRGPPTGEESKTLLFVGNLSFSVTNESLAAAFTGCKVKSATVVTRKFGQSAGRSKGFAFVDFASPEDQKKALEEFQGKELESRPLSLKVAVAEAAQSSEDKAAQAAESVQKEEKKDVEDPEASIVAS